MYANDYYYYLLFGCRIKQLQLNQKLCCVTLFTRLICCSRKKGFRHLFTFTIKALTCTYVLAGLAHFTYSASIVWNRKTKRSLVRGRSTYISKHKRLYLLRLTSKTLFVFHSLHCLFIRKSGRHLRPTLELTSPYLNIFCMLRLKRVCIQSCLGYQFIKGIFPSVGNGQNAYICGIYI